MLLPIRKGRIIGECRYTILRSYNDTHTGADDGTRTRNLLITNQLLCQLSYVGLNGAGIKHDRIITKGLGECNLVPPFSLPKRKHENRREIGRKIS